MRRYFLLYGDSSYSITTVKNWFQMSYNVVVCFCRAKPRLPKNDNVKKVHNHVLIDCLLNEQETKGISKNCVGCKLHELWDMRKPSAR